MRIFLFFILPVNSLLPAISFSQNTWVQKANAFAIPRAGVVGFSIGTKGYLGTGWQINSTNYFADFWEWDKTSDAWTQKANFPGTSRGDAVGFSIGNFGYIGTGKISGGNFSNDFWQWEQATNTWSVKANLPGITRAFAVGFSIGTKGYIGTGANDPTYLKEFWEWDQGTDTWTRKADFPDAVRACAVGFSIGSKGYLGTGRNASAVLKDFWEWDQATNSWTQKADFPGPARAYAAGFSIDTKGYIGTGADLTGTIYADFYEWDQATNTWTQKANYPHQVSDIDRATFTIGCKGYFGCGASDPQGSGQFYSDFWEYVPDILPLIAVTVTGNTTICSGSNVALSASGGTSYLWSTGDTLTTITVFPTSTTSYSVTVSSECGFKTVKTSVIVIANATASFSYEYDPCKRNCVLFEDKSVNAFQWCWDMGDGGSSSIQNPCWVYPSSTMYTASLIINCNTICADTFSVAIPYEDHDSSAFVYIPNAFSPNNDESNDVLTFFIQDDFCIKEFKITLYNDLGEMVFETTNIHHSWDGTFNGRKLNSAVFVYCCEITTEAGRHLTRKGNIALVK